MILYTIVLFFVQHDRVERDKKLKIKALSNKQIQKPLPTRKKAVQGCTKSGEGFSTQQ
ncbi:hypothetical protein PITCH_A1740059 [uncultured Desulfobacterium sp.]|uniref:Uncharacterized protein n=1 Tax=uncultured Desulfobacterium sp. TaxID=201089 RepID=A0A445MUT8_9BACT|nr:hypothetical protein PITCH_A1740059 [uncultured Desulfobacterium sp.]